MELRQTFDIVYRSVFGLKRRASHEDIMMSRVNVEKV